MMMCPIARHKYTGLLIDMELFADHRATKGRSMTHFGTARRCGGAAQPPRRLAGGTALFLQQIHKGIREMKLFSTAVILAIALASGAAQATPVGPQNAPQSTTIDFSAMNNNTSITGPISGASFSLLDGPVSGVASVADFIGGYNGSVYDRTTSIANKNLGWKNFNFLFINFAVPVSGITFRFDNNSAVATQSSVGAYNADGDQLARLDLGTNSVQYDGVSGFGTLMTINATGVSQLRFSNGPNGGNGLAFGVRELSFTNSAVPEPASWALMIGGFGLIGATARRRRQIAVSA